MKVLFLISFIVISSLSFGQDQIRFQKIKSEKESAFDLPLKCLLFEKCERKRFGRIEKLEGNKVVFSYYKVDTARVREIREMEIKRREKDDLLDTLLAQSKIERQILAYNIDKIHILSGDAKLGQQAVMLGSSMGILASSFALLQSTSTNVDGSLQPTDYLYCLGIAASATMMGIFIKKRIKMSKYRIMMD